jgi:hypothetical protein
MPLNPQICRMASANYLDQLANSTNAPQYGSMAYIVVGIIVWVIAGISVALFLGKAMKIANSREGHDRFANSHTGHTATRA